MEARNSASGSLTTFHDETASNIQVREIVESDGKKRNFVKFNTEGNTAKEAQSITIKMKHMKTVVFEQQSQFVTFGFRTTRSLKGITVSHK